MLNEAILNNKNSSINKCSFCPMARNENGKLICPYGICALTRHQLEDMLKIIFGGKN